MTSISIIYLCVFFFIIICRFFVRRFVFVVILFGDFEDVFPLWPSIRDTFVPKLKPLDKQKSVDI